MSPTIASFEEKGWFLSQEGIDLIASENPEANTLDDFINCAKDMDIRLLTAKGFNKTGAKVSQIPSPLVLQVLEVRNVAMPSVNQVENPRLLSVVFTDGSNKKYKAAEVLGKVESLKLHTPPGTKFLVTKPIEIKDQILVLGPGMLKHLGGHVQELVQAWRAGKQFLKRFGGKSNSKDGEDGALGPPAFVPFKVKRNKPIEQPKISEKSKKEPEDQKDSAISEKKARKRNTNTSENKKPTDKKVDKNLKIEGNIAVEINPDSQPSTDPLRNNDISSKQDAKRNTANKRERKVKTERKYGSEQKAESGSRKPDDFKERVIKKNANKPDATTSVAIGEQEKSVIKPKKRKERKGIKEIGPISDARVDDTIAAVSDSHPPNERKSNRRKKVPNNLDQRKSVQPSVKSAEQKSSEQHLFKQEEAGLKSFEPQMLDKQNGKSAKSRRKARPNKKKNEPINASDITEYGSEHVLEHHQPKQETIVQQVPHPPSLDEQNIKSKKPQSKERLSKKQKELVTTSNVAEDGSTDTDSQRPANAQFEDTDTTSKPGKKAKKDRDRKKGDAFGSTGIVKEEVNGPSTTTDAQPEVLHSNIKKSPAKRATSKRSSQINVGDESRSTTTKSDMSAVSEKKPPRQKRERKPRRSKQPNRHSDEEKAQESMPTTTGSKSINDHQQESNHEEPTDASMFIENSAVIKENVCQKNGQQEIPVSTTPVSTTPPLPPPAISPFISSTPTHGAISEIPAPPTNYSQQSDDGNKYSTTYYNTPSQHHQPQQTQDYYYHHQDVHNPPVQQQQAMYAPMVDYSMMVPIDPNTGMPAGIYSYPPPPQPPQHQPYMQPMYYMSDQQPTYYANHQPHYTQLYDEAHYDHHYGSYGRGRGGVYNNNNTSNGRGRGGQSRGSYKQ